MLQPRAGRAPGGEGCEMSQGVYMPEGKEVISLLAKKWERTASWRVKHRACTALFLQLAGFQAPLQ